MSDLTIRDKYESALARIKGVRVHAKALTHEVLGTAIAGGTALGMGYWDSSKAVAKPNDQGLSVAYLGPIPAALAVAAVGKVGGVVMIGDDMGRLASAAGQGALDSFAYVAGRRLQLAHAAAPAGA